MFCFYMKRRRVSSCLCKLQLNREQQRSNGKSTPNHCVCDLNCVPFVVAIQSICNQEKGNGVLYISDNAKTNSVFGSHIRSLTDLTSIYIKDYFSVNFSSSVLDQKLQWTLENLEDFVPFQLGRTKHPKSNVYIICVTLKYFYDCGIINIFFQFEKVQMQAQPNSERNC